MPPMSPARRRALRAVLSALAGGGLTAAALGVGSPEAVFADATGAQPASEGTSTTTTPVSEPETGTTTTGTTTTSTTSTTTTPPASTETAAAPPPPQATTPATTTPKAT